jgi:hypothetical protein
MILGWGWFGEPSIAAPWADLSWGADSENREPVRAAVMVEQTTFWRAADVTWIEVEWRLRNRGDHSLALTNQAIVLIDANGLRQQPLRAWIPTLSPNQESKLLRAQYAVGKKSDLEKLTWSILPHGSKEPVFKQPLKPTPSSFDLSTELRE